MAESDKMNMPQAATELTFTLCDQLRGIDGILLLSIRPFGTRQMKQIEGRISYKSIKIEYKNKTNRGIKC